MGMIETRTSRLLAGVLASVSLVASAAACSGQPTSDGHSASTPSVATDASAPIAAADIADAGMAVVDSRGFTVYAYDGDSATASACVAKCAETWPIVLAPDQVPASLARITGALGVLQRPDGTRQLMLNEHPLYTFVKDTTPGDHNGQAKAFNDQLWHVMLATGTPLP
jgi:predicted lipoprotein with Yx(FWY)xxD motif